MSKEKNAPRKPPFSQQLVALLGGLLVAATLVYLGRAALVNDGAPPDVYLEVKRIERNGSDYLVNFVARNSGSKAAAAVHAEARLVRNGELVEQARATLDYVPATSQKEGGFWFENDPRLGELSLRVSGYEAP